MKYWFFGASSEYASYIIEDLESAGHEVIRFGRHNVDYNKPEEFINSIDTKELPDRVFFNANIQSSDFDYTKPLAEQKETYDRFIETWSVGFWFKSLLLKYLEDKMIGTFVFSTSSIAYDRSKFPDTILYRVLRGSEQQLIFTTGGKDKGLTVAGCCVSNMSAATKKKYAKLVAGHLLKDAFDDNEIWSVVDGEYMHKLGQPYNTFTKNNWYK